MMQIAKTFREKKIPCDVVWMDIDYMDGFRCFTFDKVHFHLLDILKLHMGIVFPVLVVHCAI